MSKNPNLDLHDFTVVYNQNLEAITFAHTENIGKIALGYLDALQGGDINDLRTASADVLVQTTERMEATRGLVDGEIRGAAPGFLTFVPEKDNRTLDEAQQDAPRIGVDKAILNVRQTASSPAVASAIHASFDRLTLDEAQQAAPLLVVNNLIRKIRREASSKIVASILESSFVGETTHKPRKRRQKFYNFGYKTPPRQEQAPPRYTVPSSEQKPSPAQIVDPIIEKIEDDSSRKTLVNINKEAILRVVRTVEILRRQATEKNQTVTDRQIYIKYRKAIEAMDPDPDLLESSKILLNLMGGKVDGQLPF